MTREGSHTDLPADPPGSIAATLRELAREELEFLIAGGVAAQLYGSARVTMDL
jgi:hypothetical protein